MHRKIQMMDARLPRIRLWSAVAILLFNLISVAAAHEFTLGGLKVDHPWTRATPPGATTGVGYMRLINTGSALLRLTGATTPAAQRVEIHTMSVEGGVMRMRLVSSLDIAPGATVELKPGGIHLMLVALNRPLRQQEMIPVTLS